MRRIRPLCLFFALALVCAPALPAQEPFAGIDLLYPEFAHPERDASAAIKQRDFRFITIDRRRKIVPGVERYPKLRARYKTRFIRQRLRIIATESQNFSFNLRARAYAYTYNRTLLDYLLKQPPAR